MLVVSQTRSFKNLKATVKENLDIMPYLLPLHDTVASMDDIIKGSKPKALKSGQQLKHVVILDSLMSNVLEETTWTTWNFAIFIDQKAQA